MGLHSMYLKFLSDCVAHLNRIKWMSILEFSKHPMFDV